MFGWRGSGKGFRIGDRQALEGFGSWPLPEGPEDYSAFSRRRLGHQLIRVRIRCSGAVGYGMLAKCSNPSCSAVFRHLREGRLFRLENDHTLKSTRVEYFWLCQHCSPTMTLRVAENETVVAVLLPEPIRGAPEEVDLVSAHRKAGLLLRSVRFPSPEQPRSRMSRRPKDGHHAA